MNDTNPSYDTTLAELASALPRLATALRRAEQQRTQRAISLVHGARFKGVDQLLRWLDDLVSAFVDDTAVQRIAFLVHRSRADLETATEATLSGYVAVAADAMRDVMEIENLLLDFAINPTHVDEWLTANRKTLLGKFAPSKVRARLHAAGEGQYADSAVSIDYQAHSTALHVSPHHDLVASRGFSADQGWAGDAGFWEIFEHTRRLRRAIQRLTGALTPGSPVDQLAGQALTEVEEAWKRTQEMQAIYLALLRAIAEAESGENDEGA